MTFKWMQAKKNLESFGHTQTYMGSRNSCVLLLIDASLRCEVDLKFGSNSRVDVSIFLEL